jgi:hypothetical protein
MADQSFKVLHHISHNLEGFCLTPLKGFAFLFPATLKDLRPRKPCQGLVLFKINPDRVLSTFDLQIIPFRLYIRINVR